MRKRGAGADDRETLGFFPINENETFNAGTIVCETILKGQVGRIISVITSRIRSLDWWLVKHREGKI